MNDHDDDYKPTMSKKARDVGRTFRLLIIAALIVVLVVLALDNTDDVPIGYAFGDTSAPVWIVLVAAAVGGVVIGWLFEHRPRRHD